MRKGVSCYLLPGLAGIILGVLEFGCSHLQRAKNDPENIGFQKPGCGMAIGAKFLDCSSFRAKEILQPSKNQLTQLLNTG